VTIVPPLIVVEHRLVRQHGDGLLVNGVPQLGDNDVRSPHLLDERHLLLEVLDRPLPMPSQEDFEKMLERGGE
jgi:hypothetical protein